MLNRNGGNYDFFKKHNKVLQWSNNSVFEVGEFLISEDPYLWSPEMRNLANQLRFASGGLYGLVALRGYGKSRGIRELWRDLDCHNRFALRYIWDSATTPSDIIEDIEKEDTNINPKYLENLVSTLALDIINKNKEAFYVPSDIDLFTDLTPEKREVFLHERVNMILRTSPLLHETPRFRVWTKGFEAIDINSFLSKHIAQLLTRKSNSATNEAQKLLTKSYPLLEGSLKKSNPDQYKKLIEQSPASLGHITILLDMRDYDIRLRSAFIKDLESIWKFYRDTLSQKYWRRFSGFPNLVVAIQEELYHSHFFLGKLNSVLLKPFTPSQMVKHYHDIFGSLNPFNEDALKQLAFLSRGAFRRFKMYIATCLTNAEFEPITVANVNDWVSFEPLNRDMQRIFPRHEESRDLATQTLKLLAETEGNTISQSVITKEIFDGNKMQASRNITALEKNRYVKRKRKGKGYDVQLIM